MIRRAKIKYKHFSSSHPQKFEFCNFMERYKVGVPQNEILSDNQTKKN